jgi:single-stranded-DNA-specific exonuclease
MTRLLERTVPLRQSEMLRQAGLHPMLARVFAARGLSDAAHLSNELKALQAPASMLHLQRAAVFLADAITAGRKMTVVADYDCDGATACAVALRGLRMMGAQVDFIVPNRFEYGYGLTPAIVELVATQCAPDIIITVDNGIASIEGVEEANRRGMEVVVTDHHLPGEHLPRASVIVNPNQPGCGFASKNLAGVGVMFYVLLALRAEFRQRGRYTAEDQPRLDNLLDLVALGTVADVVKLDANNRVLVAQGLRRIRQGRMQPGLAALFRVAAREARQASPFDLGFGLGPRLNAAGRLADMSLGIACLLSDSEDEAWQLAQQLDAMNRERRSIEADMQDTALLALDHIEPHSRHTLCLFDESWHQGVIGIVASRLKDKFHRPTITFAPGGDGSLRGSGRSIGGFHLRDALDLVSKRAPHLISRFGGHAMAAGLSLNAEGFDAFSSAFEDVGQAWLTSAQLQRLIETDGSLAEDCYTPQFVDLLASHVWGQGFPAPLFCDEFTVLSQRVLKEKHLKLLLERKGRKLDAIWFNHAEALPSRARLAYRLDLNEFNGNTKVQLLVEHGEAR